MAGLAIAALSVALWTPAAIADSTARGESPRRGHLVLNGGGSKPDEVMRTFVDLAGGSAATIVVIPTASAEPDTGEYYRELFAGYGVTDVTPLEIRTRQHAADRSSVDRLANASGIFFSGGDQRRITEVFLDTPAADAIRRAYESGAVIGGTSAGTACMSDPMITGDGEFDRITADNVVMTPGLGLFPGAILDQHFIARGRQNRLISVVLENPELLGIGIDEATAIWLRPDDTFEVLGEGAVMVFDARGVEVSRKATALGASLGARGVTLHLLLPGERFDLVTGRPMAKSDEE